MRGDSKSSELLILETQSLQGIRSNFAKILKDNETADADLSNRSRNRTSGIPRSLKKIISRQIKGNSALHLGKGKGLITMQVAQDKNMGKIKATHKPRVTEPHRAIKGSRVLEHFDLHAGRPYGKRTDELLTELGKPSPHAMEAINTAPPRGTG